MAKKTFDPNLWSIEKLLDSLYVVPVYQRPYSWEDEQINTLLSDIFNSYLSDSSNDGYYTGNIIIHDKEEKVDGRIPVFEVVDGQQRITTFVLLLASLYALSQAYGFDQTDISVLTIKKLLWKIVKDRKPTKENPVLVLNSIEKMCFSDLMNSLFDSPNKVYSFAKQYECRSKFELNVMHNFMNIYDKINAFVSNSTDRDELLNFAKYCYESIYIIAIISETQENKVFSMFESINSKGKKLDEIDLIKSFIFSKLKPDTYQKYLTKWGNLIIKTGDNLYDYLQIYIKGLLVFYRNNISISNFKVICEKQLLNYFDVLDVGDALERLIDDLENKVKYYNMLSDPDSAYSFIRNNEFRFFFKTFSDVSFKHPRPLFFKTFIDFSEQRISKDEAKDIVVSTVKFMIQSLSICNVPSKDVITMFSEILGDIYSDKVVNKDKVNGRIASELIREGINDDTLKNHLKKIDAYETNKRVTVSLLALYEALSREGDKIHISYDQAFLILDNFSSSFSLDHLLVQTPNEDDVYKYYKKSINGSEILVLKEGHDFPVELVQNGMDYSLFSELVLNKIGNLRVYYKDKNSDRQNEVVALKEYDKFYTYEDVKKRENTLVEVIIDNILNVPQIDVSTLKISVSKKEAYLPKMDELIDNDLIKIGDRLYITTKPYDSIATLIDAKYVEYNDERMTLNDWGCFVTGWKSIRIYQYAAVVGEKETLQDKRMRLIESEDDNEE